MNRISQVQFELAKRKAIEEFSTYMAFPSGKYAQEMLLVSMNPLEETENKRTCSFQLDGAPTSGQCGGSELKKMSTAYSWFDPAIQFVISTEARNLGFIATFEEKPVKLNYCVGCRNRRHYEPNLPKCYKTIQWLFITLSW
jgi:hypothetical protein